MTKPTTVDGLREALARIKEFSVPRRKQLLVVEDNPAEQLGIRELLHHDDIDICDGVERVPKRSSFCATTRAIASFSTSSCRTCRASTCWNR